MPASWSSRNRRCCSRWARSSGRSAIRSGWGRSGVGMSVLDMGSPTSAGDIADSAAASQGPPRAGGAGKDGRDGLSARRGRRPHGRGPPEPTWEMPAGTEQDEHHGRGTGQAEDGGRHLVVRHRHPGGTAHLAQRPPPDAVGVEDARYAGSEADVAARGHGGRRRRDRREQRQDRDDHGHQHGGEYARGCATVRFTPNIPSLGGNFRGPRAPVRVPTRRFGQYWPVRAIASRRATRSSVGGWVENRRVTPPAENGFAIIIELAGATCPEGASGRAAIPDSIRRSALARASGSPVTSAPDASAWNSLDRLIA